MAKIKSATDDELRDGFFKAAIAVVMARRGQVGFHKNRPEVGNMR